MKNIFFFRINSVTCGATVERLLPVIVRLNSKHNYTRLGPDFTLHLVNTIAAFGESIIICIPNFVKKKKQAGIISVRLKVLKSDI